MFTGLIECTSILSETALSRGSLRLSVEKPREFGDINTGDSIAVSGVCLTVAGAGNGTMSFDVVSESSGRTTLSGLKKGDCVNLERALKAGQRMGGHFVTGHVDCRGIVRDVIKSGKEAKFKVKIPEQFEKYIVPKGSVAIDGISLTVGEAAADTFTVYVIPHTLKYTTLGLRKKGDEVNIEVDMLAKYILKNSPAGKTSKISMNFLRTHGFA